MDKKVLKENVRRAYDECVFQGTTDPIPLSSDIEDVSFRACVGLNHVISVTMDFGSGYMALRTKDFSRKEMIDLFTEFLLLIG